MGGRRISDEIFAWILTNHATTSFPLYHVTDALELTDKQVRAVLRRFVTDGKLEKISDQEWKLVAQTPSVSDATPIGENYASPAHRAREEMRAARKAAEVEAYAFVDTFNDGALLLRGTDGHFYRGVLTVLG